MANRPPPAPKPPADIDTNREARDQYWEAMEQYYKDQGVEDYKSRAKADVNRARENQRTTEQAAQVSQADKDRINRIYSNLLGRRADNSGIVTYSKMSDEEIRNAITQSLEYNQRKGNISVVQNRDRHSGQGAQIVFHNNAGGLALLNNKDWLRANIKNNDVLVTPKDYGDAKWGSDFDELKQSTDKNVLTAEDLKAAPYLAKAGYKVGDKVTFEVKIKKPRSGLFNWIDDALGTNTARFWDKHVSDQVKGILYVGSLGTMPGFTRNHMTDAIQGASKAFGASEKTIMRNVAYASLAADIGLAIMTFGASTAATAARLASMAAIKKSVESYNRYQAGDISSKKFFADVGVNVATAAISAGAARAGATAASGTAEAAQAGTTGAQVTATGAQVGATGAQVGATGAQVGSTVAQTGATVAQTGATGAQVGSAAAQTGSTVAGSSGFIARSADVLSDFGSAVVSTRGGTTSAIAAVNYAGMRASGMSDSEALRETGWSVLGSGTGGISNIIRYATSTSAQNSLIDPQTGDIDPLRVARVFSQTGIQAYAATQGPGGFVGNLQRTFSPSALNPVAGVARLGDAANQIYERLAGVTYGKLTHTAYPSVGEASGAEYGGFDYPYQDQAMTYEQYVATRPYNETPIRSPQSGTVAVDTSGLLPNSSNYGRSATVYVNPGTESEHTMRVTQNYLPSMSGFRDLVVDIGNATVFGSVNPTARFQTEQTNQYGRPVYGQAYYGFNRDPLNPYVRQDSVRAELRSQARDADWSPSL